MHLGKRFVSSIAVFGILAAESAAFGDLEYLFTVDTSSISGQSGWLNMQFNPGGAPAPTGSATVSQFSTDSTLNPGSIQLTGDCTGDVSPPTSLVQFNNSTAFNDYFEGIVFGNTMSFHVTLAGDFLNPPIGTLSGSTFFLGFYDSAITQPLLSDPGDFTGSAARIDVLFDGTISLLPSTSAATIVLVPEPASLGLLIAGAVMILRRRMTLAPGRAS